MPHVLQAIYSTQIVRFHRVSNQYILANVWHDRLHLTADYYYISPNRETRGLRQPLLYIYDYDEIQKEWLELKIQLQIPRDPHETAAGQ